MLFSPFKTRKTAGDCVAITGYTGQDHDLRIPGQISGKDVLEIADAAFARSKGLRSAELPATVGNPSYLGEGVFMSCTALTSVRLPHGLASLPAGLFEDCPALTAVTIPPTVTEIGPRAFSGCSALTRLDIPCSVRTIRDRAFAGCTGLTDLRLTAGVTGISPDAFENCPGLVVTCPAKSAAEKQCVSLGVKTRLPDPRDLSGDPPGTRVAIPDMGAATFRVLPLADGSLEIRGGECPAAYLAFPRTLDGQTVTALASGAFAGRTAVADVVIPKGYTRIGHHAFAACPDLFRTVIGEDVTAIGAHAFAHCEKLTRVVVPAGVTVFGNDVFSDCPALTVQVVPGSPAEAYCRKNSVKYEAK